MNYLLLSGTIRSFSLSQVAIVKPSRGERKICVGGAAENKSQSAFIKNQKAVKRS